MKGNLYDTKEYVARCTLMYFVYTFNRQFTAYASINILNL